MYSFGSKVYEGGEEHTGEHDEEFIHVHLNFYTLCISAETCGLNKDVANRKV